ncbi:Pseudouridine-5'-phosphate glycosidase [Aduncisulcus paluster]|uniref:Pseudouridine-5'-phosphate glycosidase n=1 Tax=Aduncisulcus paluster TaxID=2918883 RepID=A0ABQ5KWZ3_9EUKA|nr:Pseudouridine-5'-phosphate glycosidase [Aduncisulcus paluster]
MDLFPGAQLTKRIMKYVDIHPNVLHALSHSIPIVALESTVISHGMEYPANVETAKSLEKICIDNDCVPATIAIINGRIKVGLNEESLEILGKREGTVMKSSIRDLPYILTKKYSAGTTVACTSAIATLVGIRVFATGGCGGVHRGPDWDVSADLKALFSCPICVVSAGVKAILDIPKTVEALETNGVCVLSVGCEDFPAFYSRSSGVKSSLVAADASEAADIICTHFETLSSGVLLANPIPEKDEIPSAVIDLHISRALKECEELGIKGKDVTPFLLKRVNDLSGGSALKANIALIRNNVSVACTVAKKTVEHQVYLFSDKIE